ncbi:MAG: hypothetical protein IJ242_02130, partial [Clostridia bacterium]|nr:hypothetical protein [Clostridia bacterium]
NDFIARLQITQKLCHIQRGGAAGGQKCFLCVKALFQPFVALFGKRTVSAQLAVFDGLLNIGQFTSVKGRPVK